MADSEMTRRHVLCMTGALFAFGCSQREEPAASNLPLKERTPLPTIAESWDRIHTWLSVHAPKILGNLNPPATKSLMDQAESSFGIKMPDDWRELYQVHNGMNWDSNTGCLFYGMELLSLDGLIRESNEANGNPTPSDFPVTPVAVADAGIRAEDFDNEKWITFAHDGGDTMLCIDMDPAPSGTKGQVIFRDTSFNTVILLHKSLAEMMSAFANDLEAGRYFLSKNTGLREGTQTLDCDPEIDVRNWPRSKRWKHLQERLNYPK